MKCCLDSLYGLMKHRYISTWAQTTAVQCKLLADAEEVVRKEQQIMTDEEFPQDYLLTVFPFTRDVSVATSLVFISRGTAVNSSLFTQEFCQSSSSVLIK